DKEAKKLFEDTCSILGARKDETQLRTWGVVRAAFESDLQKLPYGVVELLVSDVDARTLLNVSVDLFYSLERGQNLLETLNGLSSRVPASKSDKKPDENWKSLRPAEKVLLVLSVSSRVIGSSPNLSIGSGINAKDYAR